MRFDILTIFPEFFGHPPADGLPGEGLPAQRLPGHGILGHGILERALRTGLASVHTHDLRAFTHDRHRTVDDRPFGGGEGMVLKAQPIYDCLQSLSLPSKSERTSNPDPASNPHARQTVLLLSAQGKRFTQATARRLSTLDRIVLICGRYEGVDERVSQLLCDDEISIGDFVLSGGELPAAILVDAVTRLLPGVLGHADSSRFESFGEGDRPLDALTPEGVPRSTHGSGGLLDYPHYTRPADFLGLPIPPPLGSGDHLAIRRWRRHAALAKTLANRPDLLASPDLARDLSDDDRAFLASLGYNTSLD